MSDSPEVAIRGIYEAFGRGDVPALLSALDESVEWRAPDNLPQGGDFRGREGVGQFFQALGDNWDGLTAELEGLVSGGDRVVALVRLEGRLRATGEDRTYSSAHAWTVRDGKVVRFAEYVDAPLGLPTAHAVTT